MGANFTCKADFDPAASALPEFDQMRAAGCQCVAQCLPQRFIRIGKCVAEPKGARGGLKINILWRAPALDELGQIALGQVIENAAAAIVHYNDHDIQPVG